MLSDDYYNSLKYKTESIHFHMKKSEVVLLISQAADEDNDRTLVFKLFHLSLELIN
jgi:hypothetical protein